VVRLHPARKLGEIVGELRDLEGPLQVDGTLHIQSSGYDLLGRARPLGASSDALTTTLQQLGPPDDQGYRQFSIEGTF
jgi:hypothetical protein